MFLGCEGNDDIIMQACIHYQTKDKDNDAAGAKVCIQPYPNISILLHVPIPVS
jgi:hypothetical protein